MRRQVTPECLRGKTSGANQRLPFWPQLPGMLHLAMTVTFCSKLARMHTYGPVIPTK